MWVWLCAFRIEWARVRRGTAGFFTFCRVQSVHSSSPQTTQGRRCGGGADAQDETREAFGRGVLGGQTPAPAADSEIVG